MKELSRVWVTVRHSLVAFLAYFSRTRHKMVLASALRFLSPAMGLLRKSHEIDDCHSYARAPPTRRMIGRLID